MGKDPDLIQVGEMARRCGLTARTLKYYEERGLLTPVRSRGRFRLYSAADVERVARIRQLRAFQLSFDAIEAILQYPTEIDDDGVGHLSSVDLEAVYQALMSRRDALCQRIEQARHEMADVETVVRGLERDIGYLKAVIDSRQSGRIRAGAPSAETLPDATGG